MNSDLERAIKKERHMAKIQRRQAARLPHHAATETPPEADCPIVLSADINDYNTDDMTAEQREVAAALLATGYYKGCPRYEPDAYYMRHNLLTNTISVCGKKVITLKGRLGFKFYFE